MTNEGALAAFLRSRREQVKPEQVGLTSSGRRRTPGLRREELAMLAGLSMEYLERLEQGRDTNPSVAVLGAIADALRLSEDDKRHLASLAMKRHNSALCPAPGSLSSEPRPTLRALLDHLDPTPAYLLGPICNILAWNAAFEAVGGPLGAFDECPPNLLRNHFLRSAARRSFSDDDWESTADELVGWLRSSQPSWGDDDEFRALVDDLSTVPEFARRWAAHSVAYRQPAVKRLFHPDAGVLNIVLEVLLVGDADRWLQVWLPYDEETAAAINALLPPRTLQHRPVAVAPRVGGTL
ncbi:helix-turn-helix transcriptional regulator [Streptomyces nigra]|uniref:helix-turn-helix transcriptional regulator n=1 Tax=Streptomyces nigra TaxID=1827580 RepID=UPI0036B1F5C3